MSVSVALVRTHSPGNLGAVARAALNFGASLVLVDPRSSRDDADARAFASGAEALLDGATVLPDLAALENGHDFLVALTSLRGRAAAGLPPSVSWPALRRESGSLRVALVFGPERSGLKREELRSCGARISLPSRPAFPTLNLAQAVAASLALLASARPRFTARVASDPAPATELTRLLARLRETLALAGWPGKGHSLEVLAEIASMLRRARPTSREVTLLLGALAVLDRRTIRAQLDRDRGC